MRSLGAATFWMNRPAPVEPLRLRNIPLLAAALCFTVGDIIAHRWQPTLLLVTATTLLLALTILALRHSLRVAIVPALALWIAIGCWCAQMQPPVQQQRDLQRFADGLSRNVRGRIIRVRSLPAPTQDLSAPQNPQQPWLMEPGSWETDEALPIQSIDLDLSAVEYLTPDISTMQPIQGGVRIALTGAALPLHCGEIIELPLRLRTPDIYRTPGAWSYADQLLGEGIGVTASAPSTHIHILTAAKPSLQCRLYAAQTWAAARLNDFATSHTNRALPHTLQLSPDDTAMLSAMLFGDRTQLSHTLRSAFERTGTFHLFVVSGMHVALLAAALFWLLRRCRVPEGLAVVTTIALTTVYAALTGFGVPAQRALLMTAIYLVARWLDRKSTALNALAAAALVVLAVDPRALFEASFQMTFLVIIAIAGIGVPLSKRFISQRSRALHGLFIYRLDPYLHPKLAQFRVRTRMACDLSAALLGKRLRYLPAWLLRAFFYLADAVLFSLIAELCMTLPMAIYFHRATLLALPLNLLDIPLLCVLLCVAVLMFLASLVSPWLAALPSAATALLLHLMRFTVDHVAHASLADLRTPAPTSLAALLAGLAIAVACIALRAQQRLYLTLGIAALLCIPVAVLYPTPPLLHAGVLEVTALDVGQGDSLLVVSPTGQTMLVDAGGPVGRSEIATTTSFDIGEEVVAPYLWSRRIRRLDVVMLTHAHSDHMGGMTAILRDFQPRELWLSIEPGSAPGLQVLLAQARAQHILIRHLHAGNAFLWSDLRASVLSPELPYTNPGTAINDDSLVLRLDDNRASVLLEGDAEAPSEATMLALHRLAPATLLKVGHHGSKTSTNSDFLAAVAPKAAVISVGRHNTFGHPRSEVLARLEAAHIQTFRTDRAGAETFLLSPNGEISAHSAAAKSP